MDWTILTSALSVLCGSSTIVTVILYSKQQKRFKTAEAFEKEVAALKTTVESMRQQLQFYDDRLTSMQSLVVGKDVYIRQLSKEKSCLEVKNSRSKSAMNKAYECSFCTDASKCPVLIQRTANEEEYLKKLKKEENATN